MRGSGKRAAIVLIGLMVVAIITFFLAVDLEAASVLGKRAPRAYEGFSAAFGLIAVSAALTAVVIALPSFWAWARSQIRSPKMALGFEIADSPGSVPRRVDLNRDGIPSVELEEKTFIVRVTAVDNGVTPLDDALLNIYAPVDCDLTVIDDPRRQHYLAVLPVETTAEDRAKGDPDFMACTVGYDTFGPGVEHMFHVRVDAPGPGSYRMSAYLDAEPDTARRIDVRVRAPS